MTLPTPQVWLDSPDPSRGGIQLPYTADDYSTVGAVLAGLTVRWGRENVRDDSEPGTLTFEFHDPTGDYGRGMLSVGREGFVRDVMRGRITDVSARPHLTRPGQILTVTVMDSLAELGNTYVGDIPWSNELIFPGEPGEDRGRLDAIMSASPVGLQMVDYPRDPLYNANVIAVDADRRSVVDLFKETLDSIDCIPVMSTPGTVHPDNVQFRVQPRQARYAQDVGTALNLDGGTSGDYVSTPDHPSLNPTGTLDIRIDITSRSWDFGGTQFLIAKRAEETPNVSYQFLLYQGKLQFAWSPTPGSDFSRLSTTTVEPGPPDIVGNRRLALRAVFIPATATGNVWSLRFYTAPTMIGPWSLLGDVHNGSAPSSITASDDPLTIGGRTNSTTGFLQAYVHSADVRAGINGTSVAAPEFLDQEPGTTQFTDLAGKVWTPHGDAHIFEAVTTPPLISSNQLEMSGEFLATIADITSRVTIVAYDLNGNEKTYYYTNGTRKAKYGERNVTVSTILRNITSIPQRMRPVDLKRIIFDRTDHEWRIPQLITRESMIDDDDISRQILRQRHYTFKVKDLPNWFPIPPTYTDGVTPLPFWVFLIIGGEYRHDGNEWEFSMNAVRMPLL